MAVKTFAYKKKENSIFVFIENFGETVWLTI